jgi:predicted nucleic acid-binding protein
LILVDTSVWVDFFNSTRGRGGDELERLIETNSPVAIAGITVTEVLQVLRRDVAKIARLLAGWPLLEPRGIATYMAAAGLYRQARARGLTLSTVDVLLAEIVIEHQAVFFTLDNDFDGLRFTGLQLHNSRAS